MKQQLDKALVLASLCALPAACNPGDPAENTVRANWGTTVQAATHVPAISGGTLIVARDGTTAVAADPDRDRVWVVDLRERRVVHQVALPQGSEPGRLAEDNARRVHVALRASGELATIDLASGGIVARRAACPAPRGVTFDAARDAVHVACLRGQIATLPAGGGEATRVQVHLADGTAVSDLRDVIVRDGGFVVSQFRSAHLLRVGADGTAAEVLGTQRFTQAPLAGDTSGGAFGSTPRRLPGSDPSLEPGNHFENEVAWRTIALPDGQLAMVHQRALTNAVQVSAGGYTGGGGAVSCPSSIVHGSISLVSPEGTRVQQAPPIPFAVLPVDMAVSRDGNRFAIVAAGNSKVEMPQLMQFDRAELTNPPAGCGLVSRLRDEPTNAQLTAVAYDGEGRLISQSRQPAALFIGSARIALPGADREDTGHAVFHNNSGGFLACASCHPEGGDDGRTWTFADLGALRTQYFQGSHLLGSAPFHWRGDMTDLAHLSREVFTSRMNNGELNESQLGALGHWLDEIPALPRVIPTEEPARMTLIEQGRTLFHSAEVGCANCHGGERFASNATVNVGTGGEFQVPTLIGLAYHAPYMHNGCAATLRERFTNTACGGGEAHGHTAHLAPHQIDAMIAYLETL